MYPFAFRGYIWPYIPPLVLIRIQAIHLLTIKCSLLKWGHLSSVLCVHVTAISSCTSLLHMLCPHQTTLCLWHTMLYPYHTMLCPYQQSHVYKWHVDCSSCFCTWKQQTNLKVQNNFETHKFAGNTKLPYNPIWSTHFIIIIKNLKSTVCFYNQHFLENTYRNKFNK